MRLVHLMGVALLVLMLSSCSTLCGPELESGYHIEAAGPVISSPEGAVLIARAIWYSLRPDRERLTEAEWLAAYTATEEGDAWRVHISTPAMGGGTEFRLNRRDGKLLSIVFSQ